MAGTNKKIYDDDVESAKVKLDGATEALDAMNYDSFKQGSMYGSLKKSYEQQGQQAMKDTLGQVAARTGGMASSYATTAAQQTYNNYMSQLEDVARSMYNDEYSRARDKVTLAQGDYDRVYGEYRDNVSDDRYNTEWQYQLDKDAKSVKDTELKTLLGSEDFDWDNHDWDGDGMIGAADTDGEGTPADFFEGSTYGVDFWREVYDEAQSAHAEKRHADNLGDIAARIANGEDLETIARRYGVRDNNAGWKAITGMTKAEMDAYYNQATAAPTLDPEFAIKVYSEAKTWADQGKESLQTYLRLMMQSGLPRDHANNILQVYFPEAVPDSLDEAKGVFKVNNSYLSGGSGGMGRLLGGDAHVRD